VDLAVAAGDYSETVRSIAHGLKFRRRLSLARVAAEAIARTAGPLGVLEGELVPVPPAPWRRRARGFDPAEEIALALASATGLRLSRCLRRDSGPRQVGRSRADRLADPPRVRLRRGRGAPAHAILVDDVRTTGSTLGACAEALRRAGCTRVVAVTLARSR
jgi:predicted amidophosphoribosyltransferase